jgi:hypothetical protein
VLAFGRPRSADQPKTRHDKRLEETIGQAKSSIFRCHENLLRGFRIQDLTLERKQQDADQSEHRDAHHPCNPAPFFRVYDQSQMALTRQCQGLGFSRIEKGPKAQSTASG